MILLVKYIFRLSKNCYRSYDLLKNYCSTKDSYDSYLYCTIDCCFIIFCAILSIVIASQCSCEDNQQYSKNNDVMTNNDFHSVPLRHLFFIDKAIVLINRFIPFVSSTHHNRYYSSYYHLIFLVFYFRHFL